MRKPILENTKYELFLEGYVASWEVSGTSDHYFDYTDTYYQWRGSGVIRDKETGTLTQFNFNNAKSRRSPPSQLSHLLLQTTREVPDGRFGRRLALAPELAIAGQEEALATIVCEQILEEIGRCEDLIKQINIKPIPFDLLVSRGFAADYSGQFHLAL